jgi:hypothetical protein
MKHLRPHILFRIDLHLIPGPLFSPLHQHSRQSIVNCTWNNEEERILVCFAFNAQEDLHVSKRFVCKDKWHWLRNDLCPINSLRSKPKGCKSGRPSQHRIMTGSEANQRELPKWLNVELIGVLAHQPATGFVHLHVPHLQTMQGMSEVAWAITCGDSSQNYFFSRQIFTYSFRHHGRTFLLPDSTLHIKSRSVKWKIERQNSEQN